RLTQGAALPRRSDLRSEQLANNGTKGTRAKRACRSVAGQSAKHFVRKRALASASGEEFDERVHRRWRQGTEVGHHALWEALLDVGIRIDDRLVDERRQRLARRLRVALQLVEVGADHPGRSRSLQRVTRATAVVVERLLARRERRGT